VRVVKGIGRDARGACELVRDTVKTLHNIIGVVIHEVMRERSFPEGVGRLPITLDEPKHHREYGKLCSPDCLRNACRAKSATFEEGWWHN